MGTKGVPIPISQWRVEQPKRVAEQTALRYGQCKGQRTVRYCHAADDKAICVIAGQSALA